MSQKITIVPRLTGQQFDYELPDDVDAQVVGNIVKQAFEDGAEHATLTLMSEYTKPRRKGMGVP